jgi:hypothetical protein
MGHKSILIFILLFLLGCDKGQTPIIEEKEEQISFQLEPEPRSSIISILGPEITFNIKILSKMPSLGIKTVLELVKDSDGSSIDITSYDFNSSIFDLRVSNLLNGTLYTINIKVVSKGNSNNYLHKSFKLARK